MNEGGSPGAGERAASVEGDVILSGGGFDGEETVDEFCPGG